MEYFVYIVKCADKTLYTGITTDVARRIYEHNNLDSGAKYTAARRPVSLLISERFPNRKSAAKREYEIKQMTREEKLQFIAAHIEASRA
jgi:putative endonuclease